MADPKETQVKASMAVWFEAVHTQWMRLKCYFESGTRSHQGKFDAVFMLEAMRASLRWIDEARELNLISSGTTLPIDPYKSLIIQLRDMNAHQNEYVFGKGRRQANFEATTEFKHHADSIMLNNGYLWVGGRLNLNEAYLAFDETRQVLLANNLWLPNQAPDFS